MSKHDCIMQHFPIQKDTAPRKESLLVESFSGNVSLRRNPQKIRLMSEMPGACKDHGNSMLISSSDDLIVTDRSSRLDNGFHSG